MKKVTMKPEQSTQKGQKTSSLLALALIICAMLITYNSYAFNGSGTQTNPYQITSVSDLQQLASDVNGGNSYEGYYFQLTSDLNFNNATFTAIGTETNPFKGSFDGQGYKIMNVTLTSDENYVGVFGYIDAATATISKIGTENVTINNSANQYFGSLIGYVDNCAGISNCYAINPTITGDEYVGGLIGYATSITSGISNCYVQSGTLTAAGYCGGIVGYNKGVAISNSYSNANIATNEDDLSQFFTYIFRALNQTYFGGISGNNGGTTNNSYYSSDADFPYTVHSQTGTTGKTTAELQALASTLGEAYTNDIFSCNGGYPILKNQSVTVTSDLVIPSTVTYNGTNHVTIADGGSLIDNSGLIADSKITVESNMKVGAWNLWGSVLATNTADILNTNAGTTTGLQHDIAGVQYDYSGNSWNTATYLLKTDNLTNGEGYFVWPYAGNQTDNQTSLGDGYIIVSQNGTALNHDASFGITHTIGGSDVNGAKWVALSNPYTGKLNISDFVSQGVAVQGKTVYVYDAVNGWSSNNDGISVIKPAQGFMVATNGTASITITKPTSTTAKSATVAQNTLIKFTTTANNTTKSSYARINGSASNDFDNNDAYVLLSTNNENLVEPYFLVNDKQILKDEFKSMPYQTPINFHASKASNANFTVSNIPDGVSVSIVDLSNGSETALNNGNVFSFVANQGENNGRFVIKFAQSNVGLNDVNGDNVSVSLYPNPATSQTTLTVSALASQAKVVVNDLQGRNIKTFNLSKGQTTLNINTEDLTSGVYYIRVITNDMTKTEKLVVK